MARSISSWMKSVESRLSNHDRRLHRRPSAALMSTTALRSTGTTTGSEAPSSGSLIFGMEPANSYALREGGTLAQVTGGSIWADFGAVDIDVTGEIFPGDGEPSAGIIFRVRDSGNRLGLLLNLSASEVEWIKVEGGEDSRLGSDPVDLSPSESHSLRVTASGPDLRAYVDDDLVSEFTLVEDDATTFTHAQASGAGWYCASPTAGLAYRYLQVNASA